MNLKKTYEGNYLASWFICLLWILISSACVEHNLDELSFSTPYSNIVGSVYHTSADLYAYGVYENLDRETVAYITLLPGVGISGPEIAFKKRIAKGQEIEILSAWRERGTFSGDVFYQVSMQDASLPQGIQIRIELTRGNEGVGAEPNPQIYEKQTE